MSDPAGLSDADPTGSPLASDPPATTSRSDPPDASTEADRAADTDNPEAAPRRRRRGSRGGRGRKRTGTGAGAGAGADRTPDELPEPMREGRARNPEAAARAV